MPGIKTIQEVHDKKGGVWLSKFLSQALRVTEKISTTRLEVEMADGLMFYKKTGDNPLNKIDRTLNVLYEKAINHLNKYTIPKGTKLGFNYMFDKTSALIEYESHPKNNLILTNGWSPDGKLIDRWSLKKCAENLEVDYLEPIWEGTLSPNCRAHLINHDFTLVEEIDFPMFYRGFGKIQTALNESIMDHPIEAVILTDDETSIKIEDNRRVSIPERRTTNDYGQLAILGLANFINEHGLQKYTVSDRQYDLRYIDLMCKVFNDYWPENSSVYEGVEFSDDRFSHPQYELNLEFVENEHTKEFLSNNKWGQDLFKILIGGFRKTKKKPSHLHGTNEVKRINDVINKIKERLDHTDHIPTFEEWLGNKKSSFELFDK